MRIAKWSIKKARTMQTEIKDIFHSVKNPSLNFRKFASKNGTAFSKIFHLTKNSGVNFRQFPWANGIDFSNVENDKLHSFVRVEFFNDFDI